MDIQRFKYVVVLLLGTITSVVSAQGRVLSLDECYRLAKANYPAIKKLDLIAKSSDLDLQNATKRFLPQINFSGQATYQSEVVDYGGLLGATASAMGVNVPTLSKDQYKIQGEVSQLLYDGGITKNQKDLINVNKALQEQHINTSLYAVNNRINTIYFSILLMEAQLVQNTINKENLESQAKKTRAALVNGLAFKSNLDELSAEVVNTEMTATEFRTNRSAYLKMLSLFIGEELSNEVRLDVPKIAVSETSINRPELKAFDLQKSVYDVQRNELNSGYLPQVNAFFQGAYGRPTLNIIENKFGPWFVTGLRFSWSLNNLYTLSNKKNSLLINQRSVDVDREIFLLNTKLDVTQQDENVKKYSEMLRQDEQIIALRSSVRNSAQAQLDNGVITIHEFIQKLNAENLALQNKILHQIQLMQAKYNQKFITGN